MQLRGFIIEYVETYIDPDGVVYLGDLVFEPKPKYGYVSYFKGKFLKHVSGYEVAYEVLITALLNAKILGHDVSKLANCLAGVVAAADPELSSYASLQLDPLREA